MEIKSATKFLGNSQFKQLLHMTSELFEIWVAWIIYKIKPTHKKLCKLLFEIVDLQGSSQTMLEGPMDQSKCKIMILRMHVEAKNRARNYYSQS